jgi:hypothetical protein
VGRQLVQLLFDAGVKRSPRAGRQPGVEVILGNATDLGFCAQAAEGAATVYHSMDPPVRREGFGRVGAALHGQLNAAAGGTRARLVVFDNVYMLGRPYGRPIDEETPLNPCSRNGEVRARAAERLFEAHRRGDVLATSGRASDDYKVGGTLTHLSFGGAPWRTRQRAYCQPGRGPHVSLHSRCRRWLNGSWLCRS